MSNSSLVTYTKLSPNHSGKRNHKIDTITIHCIVGQWTAKQGCDFFARSSAQCSANYVVGKDGSIGLSVDEKNRAWTSSSSSNDNRAITIEVASDTTHPYAVTDAAMKSLIKLCADICKRNGIPKLLWKGDKSLIGQVSKQNMTVHRWFANKACPGDYLYNRHTYIANEVNKLLGASSNTTQPSSTTTKELYRVGTAWKDGKCQNQKGAFSVLANAKTFCNKYAGYYVFDSKGNKVHTSTKNATSTSTFKPYKVKVDINDLRIRKGAGTNYGVRGFIEKGVYTIVGEASGTGAKKWGLLKSYQRNKDGWIALDYVEKI